MQDNPDLPVHVMSYEDMKKVYSENKIENEPLWYIRTTRAQIILYVSAASSG